MAEKSTNTILYIVTKSVWGGAQKYVFDLATALPKNDFEVIVASGGNGPLKEKLLGSDITHKTVPHFTRDVGLFNDVLAFFEILSILNKTNPDIIHVSSSKAGGVAGVALLFYKRKTKKIFTVHGWAFNEDRPKWQ